MFPDLNHTFSNMFIGGRAKTHQLPNPPLLAYTLGAAVLPEQEIICRAIERIDFNPSPFFQHIVGKDHLKED